VFIAAPATALWAHLIQRGQMAPGTYRDLQQGHDHGESKDA